MLWSKKEKLMKPQKSFNRRDFLKLSLAAGVAAVGGTTLYEFSPWLDYEQQVEQTWKPLEKDSTMSSQMREFVRYATLAANGHNTQPWKFAIKENAIEIHPDYARRLSIVDPNDRELWISLGCALENLVIAARTFGYESEVTYPDNNSEFIGVRLAKSMPVANTLFDSIPLRQNLRSEYDGQPIKNDDLDQIMNLPLEPGVELRVVTSPSEMETTLEYVNQGNLSQYADNAFVDELIAWLRFNKKDALAVMDGLYSVCSGNPEVPRWLGQMFVAGTKPQQQADIDAKKLRSSAGAVLVASEADDKSSWVHTGQVYERLALKMTSLNLQSAFLNQPIEVTNLRGQFQSAMNLGSSLPQLLLRYGHAPALPRSLRRSVDEVLI
jgi:hypothetical protein